MSNLIKMTPSGKRVWRKVSVSSGIMYTPQSTAPQVQDALNPGIDLSSLRVLGTGHRGELAATVYKQGPFALRVIQQSAEFNDGYQGGLAWLQAQLMLEEALREFTRGDIKDKLSRFLPGGIGTPRYMGMLVANDNTHRYLMSDCSPGRRALPDDKASLGAFIDGFCRKAVEEVFSDPMKIMFDNANSNTLIGRQDAIKLDVYPQQVLR